MSNLLTVMLNIKMMGEMFRMILNLKGYRPALSQLSWPLGSTAL